jgi:dienelactone hydrolase
MNSINLLGKVHRLWLLGLVRPDTQRGGKNMTFKSLKTSLLVPLTLLLLATCSASRAKQTAGAGSSGRNEGSVPVARAANDLSATQEDPQSVHALFDLQNPAVGPFPADRFTVEDSSQLTGRRVAMPLPDCNVQVSDCEDLALLNQLDGFNIRPRLTVSFDGEIDLSSVNSANLFLVPLSPGLAPRRIGINESVWHPASKVLHMKSDEVLAQHSGYAFIVTNGILDVSGSPVKRSSEFANFLHHGTGEYHQELLDAINAAERLGVPRHSIVSASAFVTQSVTAILEKIRDQAKAETPAPASFLNNDGHQTVYPFDLIDSMVIRQQRRLSEPGMFENNTVDLGLLKFVPGAVGTLAFGHFDAPDYQIPEKLIPQVGTLTETPAIQGINTLQFVLILPSGQRPANGWPVAIFGHGGGGSKEFSFHVASKMASYGLASIAINVVGHGFGPLSTVNLTLKDGTSVSFPAGGRGVDLDGDGDIKVNEGFNTIRPYTLVANRDGLRQTAADIMHLVRIIQVGIHLDGDEDGPPELDSSRIFYFGWSQGAHYGAQLLAVEPDLKGGVLVCGGSPQISFRRLSPLPGFRGDLVGRLLQNRIPSLLNPPGITEIEGVPVTPPFFNENLPLRDMPTLVDQVDGAEAIQELIERTEWFSQSGDTAGYVAHFRGDTLPGVPEKPILIQFPKGDEEVPNPVESALVRTAGLEDVTTYFRNDLAYAENPAVPKDSHGFMIRIQIPAVSAVAAGAQDQIAQFFSSDGMVIIHPEPARFFEVPIVLPLPETLSYIP